MHITLLFEGIQTSYLVQMFLEVLVISLVFLVAMDTMLPGQQKHVLAALLFEGVGNLSLIHTRFEATAIPGIICLLWTLFYEQVPITLLFEGTETSFFVHTFFETTAVCRIVCCFGHLVTIATKACTCDIAFGMYRNTPN